MNDPHVTREYDASNFSGRVVVLAGGGSSGPGVGNGRAAALLFARRGARVLVIDMDLGAAEQTAETISAEGGEALAVAADVSQAADCAAAISTAMEHWGRVDVLVNNVGINGPAGTAVDVDLAAWDQALRVNVSSMMLMARYAVPEMARNGKGAIVHLSSIAGLTGGHPSLLYPTSRGAIVNLTRVMAAHHAEQGIRVNCVAPGLVYTPMVSGGMTPELREQRRLRSLLKTEGTAWDVAEAVVFLASDAARWITGVVLPVDAGATAALDLMPAGGNFTI